MSGSVLSRLADNVLKAAAGNSYAAAPTTAILWPDKEGQWEAALPSLQKFIPTLFVLGSHAPENRCGPAIWLKCAIAGMLPDVQLEGIPVVYLPGVARSDLRAIESCPRDLQPLAELQYRGMFWSQVNSKDWTVNAFLTSKNGGLGLDVAQDKATLEALAQALEAGVLLDKSIDELKGRQINAEWLHSLLAPNPTRDVLAWMNDPTAMQAKWGELRWKVFQKRCKSDYGFDPIGDGTLVAAEQLAKATGQWAAVAELYRDSYSSFPKVYALLLKVQPPQLGLFDDRSLLAGYPKANEEREAGLRYALSACAAMPADQARARVLEAEQEHGARRGWLWSHMGQSPLATALGHLAELARLSDKLPIGATPAQLAESYRENGWKVDSAALRGLASVQSKADLEAVSAALRAIYLPWLEESAARLQEAVKTAGGLGESPKQANLHDAQVDGECAVFVDGLRYDVAAQLKDRLGPLGKVGLNARWTSLPSVTASGKAWCSPVAHLVAGQSDDADFEPRVTADGKPLSGHNFRKLLAEHGVQALDKHETGDPSGKAWTESGDLDHYGHEHGIRLARDLDTQLAQVLERVTELVQAGWQRVRVVTDHGWLLVPGGLPKSALAKHQAETRWGRCAVLKGTADSDALTFGWDWCQDVQVAYAPGASCFIAGYEYAHGGISLQECLVPVLSLEVEGSEMNNLAATIRSVTWKGLRCVVEVDASTAGLQVDIRTKAALASSSLVASVRTLEGGKANLAIADDEHLGSAAAVVVLSPTGELLQKAATTVGG